MNFLIGLLAGYVLFTESGKNVANNVANAGMAAVKSAVIPGPAQAFMNAMNQPSTSSETAEPAPAAAPTQPLATPSVTKEDVQSLSSLSHMPDITVPPTK